MSSPLAIGAVSAVLRNLLDNGLVDVGAPLSPVKVTAVAPDTIKLDDANPPPSLNLFLYRTSLNQGWAEMGLPSFDSNGSRVSSRCAWSQMRRASVMARRRGFSMVSSPWREF